MDAVNDPSRLRETYRRRRRRRACLAAGTTALAASPGAHASFLPPELMGSVATGIAWFVVLVVPIAVIVLFWMVHVMPEKIAHKRHHPQRDAIKTLCLLSLAFGGMLWPLAWLWAFVRPVAHKAAYGTEKHEDYFMEQRERALSGAMREDEIAHLREELDAMDAKGALNADLKRLRVDLRAALESRGSIGGRAQDAGS